MTELFLLPGSHSLGVALAAFAAFAAVIALAMPAGRADRLKARLRVVARERGRLRERRLAELSAIQTKSRLRLQPNGHAARFLGLCGMAPGGASELSVRLKMAGLRGPMPEALFMVGRVAGPLLLLAAGTGAALVFDLRAPRAVLLAVGGAACGYGLPRLVLARLIARRQRAILRAFPDGLDLLLICVQAGMSVEAALARVTAEISGQSLPLAEELGLTMAELSYLPSRWRAYHNLGERTGLAPLKLVAAALAQAERYGTPISQALGAAARECREARLFEAERLAAALPPKLTVPLVLFFLPVLMTVILAPAGMRVTKIWGERSVIIEVPRQGAEPSSRSRPASPPPPSLSPAEPR